MNSVSNIRTSVCLISCAHKLSFLFGSSSSSIRVAAKVHYLVTIWYRVESMFDTFLGDPALIWSGARAVCVIVSSE